MGIVTLLLLLEVILDVSLLVEEEREGRECQVTFIGLIRQGEKERREL